MEEGEGTVKGRKGGWKALLDSSTFAEVTQDKQNLLMSFDKSQDAKERSMSKLSQYFIICKVFFVNTQINKLAKARKMRKPPGTLGLIFFGPGKALGQKSFWVKKVFWSKKFFGQKRFLGQTKFWVKKVFESNKLFGQFSR